jgi:hypothetical protein
MRKPKATVKTLKAELAATVAAHELYKQKVREYVLATNSFSNRRQLMVIVPANEKGMINGLTIPELVLLVNLSNGTGEQVILETENNGHDLLIIAKKKNPRTPYELL